MRIGIVLLLCVAWAAGGCQRTQDALVIRQRTTTSGFRESNVESTQYWTPSAMVTDQADHRIIVDFVGETVTSMDKVRKTYAVDSFDQLNARMDATRRAVEANTVGVGPEVVQELERIGEPVGNRAALVDVRATGKRETIAGHEAEEYEVKATAMNGFVWVSHEVALPLGEAERKAYRKSMAGMPVPNMQFALTMLQLGAVPLRANLDYALGKQGTKTNFEVIEVRREAVGNELFAAPDDFSPLGAPGAAPPAPLPSPPS